MKAIETMYNGYRMRSRLEARWAIFFDTLGIKYQYEAEGFELGGVRYLPDFLLPEQQCWIEIKGQELTEQEWEKCLQFQAQSEKPLYILIGTPGGESIENDWPHFKASYVGIGLKNSERREGYIWTKCLQCKAVGMCPDYEHFRPMDTFELFCDCHEKYLHTPLWGGDRKAHLSDHIKYDLVAQGDDEALIAAYKAARQARFEHGEQPK